MTYQTYLDTKVWLNREIERWTNGLERAKVHQASKESLDILTEKINELKGQVRQLNLDYYGTNLLYTGGGGYQ